jgi:HSP20 family molecular chaperone IbpA
MCHGKDFGPQFWQGCFPFASGDFPRMMEKVGHHFQECMGKFGSWIPYNVEEKEDCYLITVPLSGRTKEDVNVSLVGNTLNIKASKPKSDENEQIKEEQKGHKDPFFRFFFKFTDVDMDIELQENADLDSIKSVMANGLLRIKVGKKPAKKVDIKTEENN